MSRVKALKLCPKLILVPGNMRLYKDISKQIHKIFQKYTDKIEFVSIDEAFLDVTNCEKYQGSATFIAESIRKDIFENTKLTASAGIAPLKFLAKIASDENKPNGICVIKPEEVDSFVKKLALKKIPWVGKVSQEKLKKLGFETCEDIRKTDKYFLIKNFWKFGQKLWNFSNAIDERAIQTKKIRKSISVETTLLQDLANIENSVEIFDNLYKKLLQRIKKANILKRNIKWIWVKLKFSDFSITSVEHTEKNIEKEMFFKLLKEAWEKRYWFKIRLIWLKVNLSENENTNQMKIF